MPIPNELITDDIRGADYYDAYLKKVAKHQRYLAGEEVSDPDSPAPKPAKSTKPKITKQAKPQPKAHPRNLNQHQPSLRRRNESRLRKPLKQHRQPNELKLGRKSEGCSRCTSGSSPTCGVQESEYWKSFNTSRGKGKESRKSVLSNDAQVDLQAVYKLQRKRTQLSNTSFKELTFRNTTATSGHEEYRPCMLNRLTESDMDQ
ncbi:hypothetical protein Tco_0916823 [Tanacetum coccineum]